MSDLDLKLKNLTSFQDAVKSLSKLLDETYSLRVNAQTSQEAEIYAFFQNRLAPILATTMTSLENMK